MAATPLDRDAVAAAVAALDPADLATRRWWRAKGRTPLSLALAEAFDLGEGNALAVVDVALEEGPGVRCLVAFRDGHEAAEGEGAWRALAEAIGEGRTIGSLPDPASAARAALEGRTLRPTAALVCRPALALPDLAPGGGSEIAGLEERPLGADQSNTSVVLGDRLVLKVYRNVETGLNPDLEMNAYLAEDTGFPAVPRLGGFAEIVSARDGVATVALLQELVAEGVDAYEALAEQLTSWILAPGEVTVEFATEVAAEIGALTGALHATLAEAVTEGFTPREATRAELRAWREDAHRQLDTALSELPREVAAEVREMAPAIAEQFSVFEALATTPLVTRIHADLHLGQVLRSPGGYVILDFEGEPTRPLEERRRHGSPLRDVASMLRSLDHVARSAVRRASGRSGGRLARSGLDVEGWLRRSRERFLAEYRRTLREAAAPIVVDEDLIRAFEFAKESYEFVYAATYLPEWLWAPLEGMRGLLATGQEGE